MINDVFIIEDTKKTTQFRNNPLVTGPQKLRFYAGIVIRNAEGYAAGTFCMFDTIPRKLSKDEIEILKDFALLAEMAYRARNFGKSQSELLNELDAARRDALIDPLTKLWNRGGWDRLFATEFKMAVKKQESLAVMMIDLDHFKTINDTFGHNEGDKAIILSAELLKSAVRNSDIVARFGGEEFTIIIRGVPVEGIANIANKLLNLFRNKGRLIFDNGKEHKFTCSIGICFAKSLSLDNSQENLLKQAEQSVYQAKEKGRNRYEIKSV